MKKLLIFITICLSIAAGLFTGIHIIPRNPVTIYIEKEIPSFYIPENYGYINPIHKDDYLRLSSPYGIRNIPKGIYTGGSLTREHPSLDLYGTWRARIVAVKDGIVIDKWYVPDEEKGREGHDTFGGWVRILHPDGSISESAHLSAIYVKEGDIVEQRETIGRQGNTGLSAGPHLHFSLLRNGVHVNPLKYIRIES